MDQREQYFLEDNIKKIVQQIDELPNQIQNTTPEIDEYNETVKNLEHELEHDYSAFGSKYYWQEDEKTRQEHDDLVENISFFNSALEQATEDLEIKNEEIKGKIKKSSNIKEEINKAFDELNVLKEFEQEALKEKKSYLYGEEFYLKQDNPELYNSRIRDIDEQLEEARAQIDAIYESLAKYKDKDLERILNEFSDIDLNHYIEDEQDRKKQDKIDQEQKKEQEANKEEQTKDEEKTNLDKKQLQDNLDKIDEALKTYENLDEESPDFFEKLTAKQELLNKKEEIEKSLKQVYEKQYNSNAKELTKNELDKIQNKKDGLKRKIEKIDSLLEKYEKGDGTIPENEYLTAKKQKQKHENEINKINEQIKQLTPENKEKNEENIIDGKNNVNNKITHNEPNKIGHNEPPKIGHNEPPKIEHKEVPKIEYNPNKGVRSNSQFEITKISRMEYLLILEQTIEGLGDDQKEEKEKLVLEYENVCNEIDNVKNREYRDELLADQTIITRINEDGSYQFEDYKKLETLKKLREEQIKELYHGQKIKGENGKYNNLEEGYDEQFKDDVLKYKVTKIAKYTDRDGNEKEVEYETFEFETKEQEQRFNNACFFLGIKDYKKNLEETTRYRNSNNDPYAISYQKGKLTDLKNELDQGSGDKELLDQITEQEHYIVTNNGQSNENLVEYNARRLAGTQLLPMQSIRNEDGSINVGNALKNAAYFAGFKKIRPNGKFSVKNVAINGAKAIGYAGSVLVVGSVLPLSAGLLAPATYLAAKGAVVGTYRASSKSYLNKHLDKIATGQVRAFHDNPAVREQKRKEFYRENDGNNRFTSWVKAKSDRYIFRGRMKKTDERIIEQGVETKLNEIDEMASNMNSGINRSDLNDEARYQNAVNYYKNHSDEIENMMLNGMSYEQVMQKLYSDTALDVIDNQDIELDKEQKPLYTAYEDVNKPEKDTNMNILSQEDVVKGITTQMDRHINEATTAISMIGNMTIGSIIRVNKVKTQMVERVQTKVEQVPGETITKAETIDPNIKLGDIPKENTAYENIYNYRSFGQTPDAGDIAGVATDMNINGQNVRLEISTEALKDYMVHNNQVQQDFSNMSLKELAQALMLNDQTKPNIKQVLSSAGINSPEDFIKYWANNPDNINIAVQDSKLNGWKLLDESELIKTIKEQAKSHTKISTYIEQFESEFNVSENTIKEYLLAGALAAGSGYNTNPLDPENIKKYFNLPDKAMEKYMELYGAKGQSQDVEIIKNSKPLFKDTLKVDIDEKSEDKQKDEEQQKKQEEKQNKNNKDDKTIDEIIN